MKLIIKRYKDGDVDGDIISVENITRYTQREKNPISEERLQEIVSSQNEVNDGTQFKIVEIPEDDSSVCEIIRMLLGEKQYKHSMEFEDLYESINQFKEQLEDIQRDVRDIISPIEELADRTKTVVDKIENNYVRK